MTTPADGTSDFRIVVDAHSIRRSRHGQVSGVIYVALDDRVFPESSWSDSVVAILHTWALGLLQLRRRETTSKRLPFMDGPFAMDVRSTSAGRWAIECVRTDRGGSIIAATCERKAIATALLEAIDIVLSECRRRGWTSADLVELKMMRSKLLVV